LCLPAAEQMPPLAAGTYPQGDGYASVTVSNSGGVTLAGVLADGTTVTAARALLTGDVTALFTQLSTPGATASKGGSLSGGLTFNVGETDGDLGGDFLWFRPAAVGLKTPLYTDGWPGGIVLAALGALYDGTLKVQAGLGLPAADPVNGNAELTLSDGKLTSPITKTNFNINGNAVAKIPSGDASFTLTLAGTTGLFSGSFTPNWANPIATKPGFKGLLIQRGTRQGGSGFFLSNAKDDADPEAGRVELRASIPD
ncbi:MAG TPA: hypothetical protein VD994_15735, partial [Prosthecobacter sp.]|nr:hypothetical protein [Prosthecobacter sp.]